MRYTRLRRRMVGLVAAYAVALHALLTAFAPVAPAVLTDSLSILCAHGDDPPSQPTGDDSPCAAMCVAALGHGLAGAPPPAVFGAIAWPQAVFALPLPGNWLAPCLMAERPQAPRGPPRA